MAIEVRLEVRGEGQERWRPQVVCDHCGEPITNAGAGNVLWNRETPPGPWFTHKACYRPFVAENGRPTFWTPLSAFLLQLQANTRYSHEAAKRAAEAMGMD